MGRKPKQQPKKVEAKKVEVKKVEAKKEVIEAEAVVTTKATSVQLLSKVTELLKREGATGYIVGVVGSDNKVLPWIGATSIGDLLTIKYVIEKEISRLIDGTSSTATGDSLSPAQQ